MIKYFGLYMRLHAAVVLALERLPHTAENAEVKALLEEAMEEVEACEEAEIRRCLEAGETIL